MARDRVFDGLRAVLVVDVFRTIAEGLLILLLTRFLLAPDEYGLLYLALSILAIVLLFAQLGFAKSGARYVAEYREADPGQVPHIVRRTLRYVLVTATAVSIALVLSAESIARIVGEPAVAGLLVIGAGYVLGQSVSTFAGLGFQGFNRVTMTAILRLIGAVGKPVFVVGFVLLGLGTAGAMLGFVVSSIVAAVVGLVIMFRVVLSSYAPAPNAESGLSRRILEYSIPLTATKGANVLDKRIDIVLVGYFLSPAAVGFYTLGKQVAEFVMAPASALGFTVSPSYGERKASDNLESASRIYSETLEHTLLLYVPAAAGIVLVADPAVPLVFGVDYSGAVPVLQILAGFVVLQAITNVTSDGLDYLGRARERAIAKGVTSTGNFLLNIALIPAFGVVGAAWATVATHSVYVFVNVYVIHRELSLPVRRLSRTIGGICLVTVGMIAVLVLTLPMVSGLLSLTAVIALGVVVWAVAAVLGGLVDPHRVLNQLI